MGFRWPGCASPQPTAGMAGLWLGRACVMLRGDVSVL